MKIIKKIQAAALLTLLSSFTYAQSSQCNGLQCVDITNLSGGKAHQHAVKVEVYNKDQLCYTKDNLAYGQKLSLIVEKNDPTCHAITRVTLTSLGSPTHSPITYTVIKNKSITFTAE